MKRYQVCVEDVPEFNMAKDLDAAIDKVNQLITIIEADEDEL